MDLLSMILERSRAANHVLVSRTLGGRWGYHFPCDRSGGFHAVMRGKCILKTCSETIELEKGDVAFVMRGMEHELLSDREQKAVSVAELVHSSNAKPGSVDLISVRYEFPEGELHPFFQELPALLTVKSAEIAPHDPMIQTISLISRELGSSGFLLQRLTDILLYYALRHWLNEHPGSQPGFRTAMTDEKVIAALEALHRNSDTDWTLEKLARQVGLSRAAVATRFREALGTTPMYYLARLRLEEGRNLLSDRNLNLEEVARRSGYSTAFAFSKAFKKHFGHSPRSQSEASTAVMKYRVSPSQKIRKKRSS